MPADSDELFCQAVSAWQFEPYDVDALDDLLIAIVKLDQSAAVDLARGYLTARTLINAPPLASCWPLPRSRAIDK